LRSLPTGTPTGTPTAATTEKSSTKTIQTEEEGTNSNNFRVHSRVRI